LYVRGAWQFEQTSSPWLQFNANGVKLAHGAMMQRNADRARPHDWDATELQIIFSGRHAP
jgi:hypothetical protein